MFLFAFILSLNLNNANAAAYAKNSPACINALQTPELGKLAFQIRGSDFRFVNTGDLSYLIAVEKTTAFNYKMRIRPITTLGEIMSPLAEVNAHPGLIDSSYIINAHSTKNSLLVVTREGLKVIDLKNVTFDIKKSGRLTSAFYSELEKEELSPENFQEYLLSASLRLTSTSQNKDYLLIGTKDSNGLLHESASEQNAYIIVVDLNAELAINYATIKGADQITRIERTETPDKFKVTYKTRNTKRQLEEKEIIIELTQRSP